jgi:hypothetical protein
MRLLISVALLFSSLPSLAAPAPDYSYCELAGLALGAQKIFVGSVAARIVDRQGLSGKGCSAVWTDAYTTGERLSRGGKWSELDAVKWDRLQTFESKVLDAVISGMDLDVSLKPGSQIGASGITPSTP